MENWTIEKINENFTLDENFLFLDLGANMGQELDFLLPLGVEVHSFEPHPKMAKTIREKFKDYSNLHFNECAAWTSTEKITFFHKENPDTRWQYDGGSTLIEEKSNISGAYKIEVDALDISQYVLDLNRQVNILKLDVEGAEYHILRHLIETEAIDHIDNIFYEDHSRKIPSTFLEFYDYKSFVSERVNMLSTNFGFWQ